MAGDYHMTYSPQYTPNYTVMTQPFQPRVNPTANEKYKLRFNNGYIFDYNDFRTLKEPIEVKIAADAGAAAGQDANSAAAKGLTMFF